MTSPVTKQFPNLFFDLHSNEEELIEQIRFVDFKLSLITFTDMNLPLTFLKKFPRLKSKD